MSEGRTASDWREFLDRLLLWSGTAALATAVVYFVAYNWQSFGKLAKFGALELLVLGAVLAYWRLGVDRTAGKAALLAASILLGALLALLGQVYQTGADAWELFAAWAAMLLPWAIVGRFAALWMFWAAVANAAVALHSGTRPGPLHALIPLADHRQAWALLVFNALALAAWEVAAQRFAGHDLRLGRRLLGLAGGGAATLLALQAIFEQRAAGVGATCAYGLWVAAVYVAYRRLRPDLFMLAAACLSLIVVLTALLGKALSAVRMDAGGFLLLAVAVLAMAATSGWWLNEVRRETGT